MALALALVRALFPQQDNGQIVHLNAILSVPSFGRLLEVVTGLIIKKLHLQDR
jgi:hypothetical protein